MTTQRTWSAAVVAITLVFAAACGGGGDGNEATPTAPAPAEDSPTAASTQASAGASTSIDQSFWHAGWKVTLGEATVEDGVVEIEAQFENLGEDTATFDSRLVLMGGGETYEYDELDQEFPEVPGGLKGNGMLVFSVDDSFEFDDATLLVGNPANNQAVVPLGPNGDELVDLAPRVLPITGPATAGAVTLNVESVEVRADLPDQHSISEAGKTNHHRPLQRDGWFGNPARRGRAPEPERGAEASGRHGRRGEKRRHERGERIAAGQGRHDDPGPVRAVRSAGAGGR